MASYAPFPAFSPPPPGPRAVFAPPSAPFPERLDQSQPRERLNEAFGWFPGACSVSAFLGMLGMLGEGVAGHDGFTTGRLQFLGAALAVFLLFGAWEVLRRRRGTTLVLRERQVGLYRNGQLQGVVGRDAILPYALHPINTVREVILFGVLGPFPLLFAFSAIGSGKISEAFWAGTIGLAGTAALASTIYHRIMCKHYVVPRGMGSETLAFRRARLDQLHRLLGWTF